MRQHGAGFADRHQPGYQRHRRAHHAHQPGQGGFRVGQRVAKTGQGVGQHLPEEVLRHVGAGTVRDILAHARVFFIHQLVVQAVKIRFQCHGARSSPVAIDVGARVCRSCRRLASSANHACFAARGFSLRSIVSKNGRLFCLRRFLAETAAESSKDMPHPCD